MTTNVNDLSLIIPDWPAPKNVRSAITTREGGISKGAFSSLNLGDHVGDNPQAVTENRARILHSVGGQPLWLNQVHGTRVVDAAEYLRAVKSPEADAAFTRRSAVICTVMTADCLPVLFCDSAGTVVAAAHAGWRGLLDGVLEETVKAMGVAAQDLMAYLGPSIGPQAFEVGDEVRAAFIARNTHSSVAFAAVREGKWLADLYQLARQRLNQLGLQRVYGGDRCTFSAAQHFFSYRRDGQCGRMAAMIWLEERGC
jgi:YfiH family protein